MIKQKFNIFAYRSYPQMLGRFVSNRYTPPSMLKYFRHCHGGFVINAIFVLTAVLYSHTVSNFDQVSKNKNEFSKYNQRELPSNDQLPSTRLGLHSIPDKLVKPIGVGLDCTKGSLLVSHNYFNFSLMGMKIREGMPKE